MSENLDDQHAGIATLTFGQAIYRGVRLRCPACGKGLLFRGFFSMNAACRKCHYELSRPPGYFLGSTYINYGVTALVTTISYVALHFGFQWSRDRLLPWMLAFCVIFPLVFFRFARSLWLSLDCLLDRVGASEAMSGTRWNQTDKEVENNGD